MIKRSLLIFLIIIVGLSSQRAFAQTETIQIPGSEVTFDLVEIPGGTFAMGTEEMGGTIEVSPFWMSTHEVTHDAYRLFQIKNNDTPTAASKDFDVDAITRPTPPYLDLTYGMGDRGGFPQVNVTQQAALRYCQWLYQKTGDFYRLPTEAEWEYACLADGKTPNAEVLDDYAWYYENGEEKYHRVGQKEPNAWGLYDMLGNVSEWTADFYAKDYFTKIADTAKDPWIKPTRKHARTVKGGNYDDDAEACTCKNRIRSSPKWQERDPQVPRSIWWNVDAPFVGFRLVRPANQPSAAEIAAYFAEAIID